MQTQKRTVTTNGGQAHELNLQLIRTRRAFRQAVQRMLRLRRVEMTFEMLQVMHRLRYQLVIYRRRLAELTSKDKASLTNLVNNPIRKGWVGRRQDVSDRCNRLIDPTPDGEAPAGIVRPILDGIDDRIGERTSPRQMLSCKGCLGKLNGILDEI